MITQTPLVFNSQLQKTALNYSDYSSLKFSDFEPNYQNWHKRKHLSEILQSILDKAPKTFENQVLHKIKDKLSNCSEWIKYSQKNGVYQFDHAFFCHSRFCPVCQHENTVHRNDNFSEVYKKLVQEHPNCKIILATFTVKNHEIATIKPLLAQMSRAMTKLLNRKAVKQSLLGYMKCFEMVRPTYESNGQKLICPETGNTHARPHYHVLFVFKSTGKHYVSQKTLQTLWQDCLGVDYLPHVHTKDIFSRAEMKRLGELQTENYKLNSFVRVASYLVKTIGILGDWDSSVSHEWIHHYCKLMHGKNTISTGGIIRNIFKEIREKELVEKQLLKEKKEQEKLMNILIETPPKNMVMMKFSPSYFLAPFAYNWEQNITCNYYYDHEKTVYVNEPCTPPIPIPQSHLDTMQKPTIRLELLDDKKAQLSEPVSKSDGIDYLIQVGFLPPSWKDDVQIYRFI